MIARVIVDISNNDVDRVFDYVVPSRFAEVLGFRVVVPFGKKKLVGFVCGYANASELDKDKLKEIEGVMDDYPILSEELVKLTEFMHTAYNLRYVDVIRLFIPTLLRTGKIGDKVTNYITVNEEKSEEERISKCGRSEKKKALLKYLEGREAEQPLLNKQFGGENVKALIADGVLLVNSTVSRLSPLKNAELKTQTYQLTFAQNNAVKTIFSQKESVFLLHGVTGSGKTEVYLECIKRVLAQGKTAILLAPEISLTPQLISRFRGALGEIIAVSHYKLNNRERYDEWCRIKEGKAKVVIGARSAVFAPLDNLGMIIIDEEHDGSYYSESNPRYYAIEVAKQRAKLTGCKVVLGSATPSLESYLSANNGTYGLITLPDRINGSVMPSFQIVDMCRELMEGNSGLLSRALVQQLKDCLSAGNQAMIFLNRRGFASFVMCRKCGHIVKCEGCDVSLTYHSEDKQLKCHFCNRRYKMIDTCPQCGSKELRYGKVGTERVVTEIRKLFPSAKLLRMDNDTTSAKNTAHYEILEAFKHREADILVGTQMIAKGHDFPDVTLVGIVDADLNLYNSDFRSSERTFQLITQVAGRAGRADKEGKVVLQTCVPKHYVFRFATGYDYQGFYNKEINLREATSFPPFSTIIRVLTTSLEDRRAIDITKEIYVQICNLRSANPDDFIFLQAMKAPVVRIENKFRYQVLMRIKRHNEASLISAVYDIVNKADKKKASTFVELNPPSLS